MGKILKHKIDKLYYVFGDDGKLIIRTEDWKTALRSYNNGAAVEEEEEDQKLTKEQRKAKKAAEKLKKAQEKAEAKKEREKEKELERQQKDAEKKEKQSAKEALKQEKKEAKEAEKQQKEIEKQEKKEAKEAEKQQKAIEKQEIKEAKKEILNTEENSKVKLYSPEESNSGKWVVIDHYGESHEYTNEATAKRVYKKYQAKEKTDRKKYFTKDTLKEALKEGGMEQLKAITIDPGQAFLNGQKTNVQTADETLESQLTLSTINLNDFVDYTPSSGKSTISTLTNGLGNISTNDLLSITNDGGAGLLSKTITQATTNVMSLSGVQSLTNLAAGGLGAYGMGKELVGSLINSPEVILTLSQAIITKSIEVVTKEVTQMTTEYLMKHAQYALSFPMKITSYAMSYFNENKMSATDALKSLLQSSEGRSDEKAEKNSKKLQSEFMAKISAKSKNFINKMNKYVDKGTSYISMVTSYIENGPEWVTEQVDKQIGFLLDGVQKTIDKQWEKDKEAYDSNARALGAKAGAKMVKTYNAAIQKAQKKAQEKIKKTKVKVQAKLIATTAKAASKLGSMLGMYIPVPDMV